MSQQSPCRVTAGPETAGTTSSGVSALEAGFARVVEHAIDLGEAEAGQVDFELEVDQPLQLDRQDRLVPAGVERELVVAEDVGD